MRVEQRVEGEEERLSTEELHALRARLFGETSQDPKPITTVADLAEFLGRSPEEVWQQLDRLRAERAFAVSEPKKHSQLPLLGVAVVLLAAAYGIYKVTPRKMTDAEIDQQLEETRAERARRPKKIHYPIVSAIETPTPLVPGYTSKFSGVLTTTSFRSSAAALPVPFGVAKERVKEALRSQYEEARKREAEAPKPPQPLPPPKNNFMPAPGPDHLILQLTMGNQGTQSSIPMDPAMALPRLDQLAGSVVDSLQVSQKQALEPPRDKVYGINPPPGFSLTILTGKTSRGMSSSPLALVPVDAAQIRLRLEESVRDQIRRALEPGSPYPGQPVFTPGDTLDLKITGPLGPIEVTLPTRPHGKYKTGADAIREFERGLGGALDKAEKQIRQINAGKG